MKIHVFGSSGSGVSTLGKALAKDLGIKIFDADNYYWKKTEPPFQEAFPIEEREKALGDAVSPYDSWVISGTLVSWGRLVQNQFNAAIYLYVPIEERINRLKKREEDRFGDRINQGGDMHEAHLKFLEWAAQYDEGYMGGRSKKRHEAWMKTLDCPIKRIEGIISPEDSLDIANKFIASLCPTGEHCRV